MTEDVTFLRGNDRIKALAERPDLAIGVAATRQAMDDADRAPRDGTGRAAPGRRAHPERTRPQTRRLPGPVSRMEQPHDMLLSTLNSYLEAIGGHARMIVQFDGGHEVELNLDALR
jgi:hypothetical protein